MIDLVIVSWNNKKFLKQTIDSAIKNSFFNNQILVHLNEGTDGSEEMLKEMNISYTKTDNNVGLCRGANLASTLGTNKWVALVDDDMYIIPEWDKNLIEFYNNNFTNEIVWMSCTMIEPKGGATVIKDSFPGEEQLLKTYTKYMNQLPNLITNQATPALVQRWAWEKVGGYPEQFDLGIGSDDGVCKMLWNIGCRNFVSVSNSLVFHFQSNTTNRINYSVHSRNRDEQFKKLFNITQKDFINTIRRGEEWTKK